MADNADPPRADRRITSRTPSLALTKRITMAEHVLTDILWRKSSYSSYEECVEVTAAGGGVLVRDSGSPRGPTLTVSYADWRNFLAAVPVLLTTDQRTIEPNMAG
jgi:Domain of unknown function (DUF397)